MWTLARRHGVSVDALLSLNRLARPEDLRAGQTLLLPASTPSEEVRAVAASAVRYPLRWPLEGTITSRYGQRGRNKHDGIDIHAPKGSAVHAAADGEVVFADSYGGYGKMVLVKHAGGLVTVYAHHDRLLVRQGQRVSAGQAIATVGQTGRATGPHLHFEVRRGVSPDNPLRYLPP
ncbi:MAG: peptidoglycan DD-metalloendopeptidase family protein [Deltaproteobacteria bacterium]|nr:peptidoglycan DD-metalloendopeptidase family protein [Deltaproteobacteria bacterium]